MAYRTKPMVSGLNQTSDEDKKPTSSYASGNRAATSTNPYATSMKDNSFKDFASSAIDLISKGNGEGLGRSTSKFEKKITKAETAGKIGKATRIELNQARFDKRNNKRQARKLSRSSGDVSVKGGDYKFSENVLGEEISSKGQTIRELQENRQNRSDRAAESAKVKGAARDSTDKIPIAEKEGAKQSTFKYRSKPTATEDLPKLNTDLNRGFNRDAFGKAVSRKNTKTISSKPTTTIEPLKEMNPSNEVVIGKKDLSSEGNKDFYDNSRFYSGSPVKAPSNASVGLADSFGDIKNPNDDTRKAVSINGGKPFLQGYIDTDRAAIDQITEDRRNIKKLQKRATKN